MSEKVILELKADGALNKWWKVLITIGWSFFITYEMTIMLNQLYSSSPLCPFSDLGFDAWYWNSLYLCLGGFAMIWLALLCRILKNKICAEKIPLYVAFNIVSMGKLI